MRRKRTPPKPRPSRRIEPESRSSVRAALRDVAHIAADRGGLLIGEVAEHIEECGCCPAVVTRALDISVWSERGLR